jgi:hypothetical protein
MNHLKYLDILLEQDDKLGRWATVKDIPVDKISYNSVGDPSIHFSKYMTKNIGKRFLFKPFENDPKTLFWKNPLDGFWYHKDWLDFEDEEEPNLFTRDPKPAKVHWYSAGR